MYYFVNETFNYHERSTIIQPGDCKDCIFLKSKKKLCKKPNYIKCVYPRNQMFDTFIAFTRRFK